MCDPGHGTGRSPLIVGLDLSHGFERLLKMLPQAEHF